MAYLAPGLFEVAVSSGMPRKATSSSPLVFGGCKAGSRINDAIPPARCKSLGWMGWCVLTFEEVENVEAEVGLSGLGKALATLRLTFTVRPNIILVLETLAKLMTSLRAGFWLIFLYSYTLRQT